MGRAGWAKAIAMGAASVRAGSSAARNVGASYGFPADYDVCEAAAGGRDKSGTWTTVGTMGRVGWAKAIAMGPVECQSGLAVQSGTWGPSYGFRADYDVCEAPSSGGHERARRLLSGLWAV